MSDNDNDFDPHTPARTLLDWISERRRGMVPLATFVFFSVRWAVNFIAEAIALVEILIGVRRQERRNSWWYRKGFSSVLGPTESRESWILGGIVFLGIVLLGTATFFVSGLGGADALISSNLVVCTKDTSLSGFATLHPWTFPLICPSKDEHWVLVSSMNRIDRIHWSLYFSGVSITSIGYGDSIPANEVSQTIILTAHMVWSSVTAFIYGIAGKRLFEFFV